MRIDFTAEKPPETWVHGDKRSAELRKIWLWKRKWDTTIPPCCCAGWRRQTRTNRDPWRHRLAIDAGKEPAQPLCRLCRWFDKAPQHHDLALRLQRAAGRFCRLHRIGTLGVVLKDIWRLCAVQDQRAVSGLGRKAKPEIDGTLAGSLQKRPQLFDSVRSESHGAPPKVAVLRRVLAEDASGCALATRSVNGQAAADQGHGRGCGSVRTSHRSAAVRGTHAGRLPFSNAIRP